ncbi:hypothetical protein Lal_00005040 [Lupinus albus]|nr:hypothetical protein Lal_00005040 [Lupinus albus]
MEVSPIRKGNEKPRKTIGETIKKDLEINVLPMNMIYDRALWHRSIHVANLPHLVGLRDTMRPNPA